MYAPNSMPTHGWAPLPEDVATLGAAGADQAVAYLATSPAARAAHA